MPQDTRTNVLNRPETSQAPGPDGQQTPEQHPEPREKRPKRPLRRRIVTFPRRHPLGFLPLLIALVAVVVGVYLLWDYFQSYESTDDAQVSGHLNPVGSRINGTVIGVYTENNRNVVQNQTIVDLDSRDDQAAVEQAQAKGELAAANPSVPITETTNVTSLATSSSEVVSAQAALAAAQHDYDSAVADLRQAEANNLFRDLALLSFACVPLVFLLRKVRAKPGAVAAH